MSFREGDRVQLVSCVHGQPGIVLGLKRGRVIVRWENIDYTGKHAPNRLFLVASATAEPEKV